MKPWPAEDMARLIGLLQANSLARLSIACKALQNQLPVLLARNAESNPGKYGEALELHHATASLNMALSQASELEIKKPLSWQSALEELKNFESSLRTEMRYVYGPDWEMKPGKLVSKKGTWLKHTTQFSWEVPESQKLYMPTGVVMPVAQIGKVVDPVELKRHEWVRQHLRVWLKPGIVESLENRRGVWFVYWLHWEDRGLTIVATADTWLKRSTQMSGELLTFELIYVPKGMAVQLSCIPALVEEDWEKNRHQHVHLHRRVQLDLPPITMKQDQFDIFVGQGNDRLHPMLR